MAFGRALPAIDEHLPFRSVPAVPVYELGCRRTADQIAVYCVSPSTA